MAKTKMITEVKVAIPTKSKAEKNAPTGKTVKAKEVLASIPSLKVKVIVSESNDETPEVVKELLEEKSGGEVPSAETQNDALEK
ncbi:hypothetical protein QQ045_015834 [Rhodiola kirilowii]